LIDTAGIRPTDDAVELLGVGQSQAILQDIDLVLNVLDAAKLSPDLMQLYSSTLINIYFQDRYKMISFSFSTKFFQEEDDVTGPLYGGRTEDFSTMTLQLS
jgi:tRNA U34 5-carboxymethylaminomethyl modifying GTPase MnmE/TrmE